MIGKMQIFGWRINFVFRHKFEKDLDLLDRMRWKEYKLGIWFKKYQAVGKPKKGPAILGKGGTHTNCYMFGVHLLVCKCWVDLAYRPLTFKID